MIGTGSDLHHIIKVRNDARAAFLLLPVGESSPKVSERPQHATFPGSFCKTAQVLISPSAIRKTLTVGSEGGSSSGGSIGLPASRTGSTDGSVPASTTGSASKPCPASIGSGAKGWPASGAGKHAASLHNRKDNRYSLVHTGRRPQHTRHPVHRSSMSWHQNRCLQAGCRNHHKSLPQPPPKSVMVVSALF